MSTENLGCLLLVIGVVSIYISYQTTCNIMKEALANKELDFSIMGRGFVAFILTLSNIGSYLIYYSLKHLLR